MTLSVGDRAPDFTLFSGPRETVTLASLLADGPIVLAFYPFAFSSTCASELKRFADDYGSYLDMGVRVFGVSVDSPYAAAEFGRSCGAEFPVLSDFNKEAVAAYGVFRPNHNGLLGTSERAVFVIARDGTVRYVWQGEHPGLEPPYDAVESAARAVSNTT